MLIIRLLGAQAVMDGATGRIRAGSSRTLALLGLLIARPGRSQDRATIEGQFWPESGNAGAHRSAPRTARPAAHPRRGRSLEIAPGRLCRTTEGATISI